MFVEAIMNGFRVKLLVDTVATLSIISPDALHAVLDDQSPIFAQVDQPFLMADRTALNLEGPVLMSLSISGLVFSQRFALADTVIDGILGLDFMKINEC